MCKKLGGKCYSALPAPQLPPFRVTGDLGFAYFCIDQASPVFVKNIYI